MRMRSAPDLAARERRRVSIEGPLPNDEARRDLKSAHYRKSGPRLDSRPFSDRETRLRPSKRRKKSRSRVSLHVKPEKLGRLAVGTYLGTPALFRSDGSLFKKYPSMSAALAESKRLNG